MYINNFILKYACMYFPYNMGPLINYNPKYY